MSWAEGVGFWVINLQTLFYLWIIPPIIDTLSNVHVMLRTTQHDKTACKFAGHRFNPIPVISH